MKPKIFIDGREGTTGLQIYDRLTGRPEIDLLLIPDSKRKDPDTRREYLNAADLVFLCLPDEAAQLAASMVTNPATRIIDASTAHRTAGGWVYGFSELREWHDLIPGARKLANPGCHATGFLAGVAPLTELQILPIDYPLTCFSLTGYSGGGKSMIAEFEDPNRSPLLEGPNLYATGLEHKHLAEMRMVAGLDFIPAFSPVLSDIYSGMATTVLLHNPMLAGRPHADDIHEALSLYYEGCPLVKVMPFDSAPRIATNALAGTDRMEIYVSGHMMQTQITAVFDNLGKGAAGAAVQNMNLMLGLPETAGLTL